MSDSSATPQPSTPSAVPPPQGAPPPAAQPPGAAPPPAAQPPGAAQPPAPPPAAPQGGPPPGPPAAAPIPPAAPPPAPAVAAPGVAAPGAAPPMGVAPPVAAKKGLGCWAIGAIVVGALVILGALLTLVFALFLANGTDDTDTTDTTDTDSGTSSSVLPTLGGEHATEELSSVDFATVDPEVIFDDADLHVEVINGELVVTSRNTSQLNLATWQAGPTSALLVGGQMSFPAATTASGQEVLGGVSVGMADDTDYALLCSTTGDARLQRVEPSSATDNSELLQEFPNAGCTGSFGMALEVNVPTGGSATELAGTLPTGEEFTYTDQTTHGQVSGYGVLVDADNAPVSVAVTSLEVYTAP